MGLLRRLRARGGGATPAAGPPPVWIVVGLGNPGPRYAATRHNVGFRVVELVAERWQASWVADPDLRARVARAKPPGEWPEGRRDGDVALIEPLTFMNHSGESLEAALARWPGLAPETDLLVVHDDLDLPLGRVRLRPSGGSGGHRGIGDVLDRLGTRALARLRVGIGHPGGAEGVLDWVLSPFPEEVEQREVPEALARAADAVEAVWSEGLRPARERFNARPEARS